MRASEKVFVFCALAIVLGSRARSQAHPRFSSSQSPIALAANALVYAPEVRLSDLLPRSAGAAQRAAAEGVLLGRAPQPGSLRVLKAAEIDRAVAGKLRVEIPEQVVVRRGGWPVTPRQIQLALDGFSRHAAARWPEINVTIPEAFVTRSANAPLKVLSLRPGWNGQTSIARLRCVEHAECGTFLVVLGASAGMPGHEARAGGRDTQTSPRALVEPNRKAWLVMAGGGMKITLHVLPLQRAGMGETVRVLDPAAHRILTAQVRGQNLLQSDLEEGR